MEPFTLLCFIIAPIRPYIIGKSLRHLVKNSVFRKFGVYVFGEGL